MLITRGVRDINEGKTNVFIIPIHDRVRINEAKRRADEVKLALHNIVNRVNDASAEEWAVNQAKMILKVAQQ